MRVEAAGPEGAHTPATHAVGASGIETFLERKYRRVAVRIAYAATHMKRKRLTVAEITSYGVVNLSLYILRELCAEYLVDTVMLMPSESLLTEIQQVTRSLGRRPDGIYYRLEYIFLCQR